jgi:hypothetical protein
VPHRGGAEVNVALKVTGAEVGLVAGVAVVTSEVVLATAQTAGAVAETYVAPEATALGAEEAGGLSTVRDFIKGASTDNPASIPPTVGGALGATARLVFKGIMSIFN